MDQFSKPMNTFLKGGFKKTVGLFGLPFLKNMNRFLKIR
jgi:hypothetical protein